MEIGDTWVRTLLKCKLTCIAGDKWIIKFLFLLFSLTTTITTSSSWFPGH
jgi:hypothetical protein